MEVIMKRWSLVKKVSCLTLMVLVGAGMFVAPVWAMHGGPEPGSPCDPVYRHCYAFDPPAFAGKVLLHYSYNCGDERVYFCTPHLFKQSGRSRCYIYVECPEDLSSEQQWEALPFIGTGRPADNETLEGLCLNMLADFMTCPEDDPRLYPGFEVVNARGLNPMLFNNYHVQLSAMPFVLVGGEGCE